jgi:P4 family phage/plasmid primase-like protien
LEQKKEMATQSFATRATISEPKNTMDKIPQTPNLTNEDFQRLEDGYIPRELVDRAGIYRVDTIAGAELVGRNLRESYAGIVFPYTWPGSKETRESRLRRDSPPKEYGRDGSFKDRAKYLSPPGRGSMIYFPPDIPESLLYDTSTHIILTEGEKKALALHQLLYIERGERVLAISIPGVWSWRGNVGKTFDERGRRVDVKGTIKDLDGIGWSGRRVSILFDTNVHTNGSVQAARRGLTRELATRGANVYWPELPEGCPVNGVDDWLGLKGAEPTLEILRQERAAAVFHALTDLGNAERFADQYGDVARYCYEWRCWFVWDGCRWSRDSALVERWAKKTVRSIYGEASRAQDEEQAKAIAKHAVRSEGQKQIRAMLDLARSEFGIPISAEELDTDPMLLTVLNGTLDLRTGKLLPHNPEHCITKLAPVAFDPSATCPVWEGFLARISDGNESLQRFEQRAAGYSLSGDVSERCIFFLYGTGANGKSTFLETLRDLLGDYATRAPSETLMVKRDGAIPNDIARLRGSRFVMCSETEDGRRLSEALVKDMTGNDAISARFLHAEFFEFRPQFKIWLATNHRPIIKGTDEAIWDRLRIIPFEVRIPPEERDKHLLVKLKQEASGILNWALDGCLTWQKCGLGEPDEVRGATDAYRQDMDTLGSFLEERCEVGAHSQVSAAAIYGNYKNWCESTGENPMAQRALGLKLGERGFKRTRGTGGRYLWEGVGLKNEE